MFILINNSIFQLNLLFIFYFFYFKESSQSNLSMSKSLQESTAGDILQPTAHLAYSHTFSNSISIQIQNHAFCMIIYLMGKDG